MAKEDKTEPESGNDNNKNKDLVEKTGVSEIKEFVGKVIDTKKGNKLNAFFTYYFLGMSPKVCANLTGYSEKYGYKLIHKYRHISKFAHTIDRFLATMPQRYQNLCKARLVELGQIEGLAIQEYRNNPKLLIDKPQLAKQVKQAAGVLDDDVPQPSTIKIESIQILMAELHKKESGHAQIEDEVIEGEIEG